MKYYELICTAYLKKEINFKESFEVISKYISYSMAQDVKLEKLHNSNRFKHYVFGGLLPIEKERVYHKGNTYTFTIRSVDESFVIRLSTLLRENINNPYLLIVETYKKIIKQFFISELYSATPVIVTTKEGRYWVKEDDLMVLYKQLQDNLEKKYKHFYTKEIKSNQNFIQLFELKNHRLQTIQTNNLNNNGKIV